MPILNQASRWEALGALTASREATDLADDKFPADDAHVANLLKIVPVTSNLIILIVDLFSGYRYQHL